MNGLMPVVGLAFASLGAFAGGAPLRTPFVAFDYGGKAFRCSSPVSSEEVCSTGACRVVRNRYRTPDGKLGLTLTVRKYKGYDAVEYLPELTALADQPTELVSNLRSFDFSVAAPGDVTVRTLRGTNFNEYDFTPVSTTLTTLTARATEATYGNWGRSSDGAKDGVIPFLGIDIAEKEGYELAVGWTGSWKADFRLEAGRLSVSGGLRETNFRVLPGETLRAPSVLLWKRSGVTARAFRTTIHRFMRDFKSPRDGKGRLFEPMLALMCGGGNKMPCTMLNQIEWAAKAKIPFDVFWVDAGWFGPPHESKQIMECGDTWFTYAGTWRFNATVHPDGNVARVADAAHAAGMKMLLWAEPERVMWASDIYKEHPELCLVRKTEKLADPFALNLGSPGGCQLAIDTVERLIRENKLDCYRQDLGIPDLERYWKDNDAPDRVGVTEMKYIAGLYAFWDAIKANHPDLLLENCAGGGRRLDIEMISRSHTYCRTDYALTFSKNLNKVPSQQAITHNLLPYLPFQGSDDSSAPIGDDYMFFSMMSTGCMFAPTSGYGMFLFRWPTADETAWFKRNFDLCRRLRPYFMGDYYPLCDPVGPEETIWCAWQFDRPDMGEGVVEAFRREQAAADTFRLGVQGIDPTASYQLTHFDGRVEKVPGARLANYEMRLDKPRSFDIVIYKKIR